MTLEYRQCFLDVPAGTLNLVMDWASQGDLYALIKRHTQLGTLLDESRIWQCLAHSIQGLASLHSVHTLHRDLKSANIFIRQDGSFAIADLNVAKVAHQLALT